MNSGVNSGANAGASASAGAEVSAEVRQTTFNLRFADNQAAALLFGPHGDHLTLLERLLDVRIVTRGSALAVSGKATQAHTARSILDGLYEKAANGSALNADDIRAAAAFATESISAAKSTETENTESKSTEGKSTESKSTESASVAGASSEPSMGVGTGADIGAGVSTGASTSTEISTGAGRRALPSFATPRRTIAPRTPGQAKAMEALLAHSVVFLSGPAGTGKTYLAVAAALAALTDGIVERIVLCRPAVEAGERLGFLPGDLREKVDPYLRPLYDALGDMTDGQTLRRRLEQGTIEVAPLAFLRGRNLARAFIILDEAQNTTPVQMKMFLTRLGDASRLVATGDPSQVDLPADQESGFADAWQRFAHARWLGAIALHEEDAVRNPLIAEILRGYRRNKQET